MFEIKNNEGLMKRTKIFLDTSILGLLFNDQRPDWLVETHRLWESIKAGKYEIIISDVVLQEVNRSNSITRQKIHEKLAEIDYTEIIVDNQVEDIADEIINMGILKEKNRNDCRHIGCAIVSNCRFLLSWNFTDLVKPKTYNGIHFITQKFHYPSLDIISPYSLNSMEDE